MRKALQQHLGWVEGQKGQSMGSLQLCNCSFLPVEAQNGQIHCKSPQRYPMILRPVQNKGIHHTAGPYRLEACARNRMLEALLSSLPFQQSHRLHMEMNE